MLRVETCSGEAAFIDMWSPAGGPRQKQGKGCVCVCVCAHVTGGLRDLQQKDECRQNLCLLPMISVQSVQVSFGSAPFFYDNHDASMWHFVSLSLSYVVYVHFLHEVFICSALSWWRAQLQH